MDEDKLETQQQQELTLEGFAVSTQANLESLEARLKQLEALVELLMNHSHSVDGKVVAPLRV